MFIQWQRLVMVSTCFVLFVLFVSGMAVARATDVASVMTVATVSGTVSTQRQTELIRMVRQDCGSCHGMSLKGGLGSPLLPEALRDKPVEGLVATVMQGRPGTAMPPWNAIITEQEAEWIVAHLLAGFPQE